MSSIHNAGDIRPQIRFFPVQLRSGWPRLANLLVALLPLATLAAIGVVAFAPHISALGLYADDWVYLSSAERFGWSMSLTHLSSFRPLHVLIWATEQAAFGSSLPIRYAILFGLLIGNAVLFFYLLRSVFPEWRARNLLASALFLVYPTVSTRFWLATGSSYIGHAVFLCSLLVFVRSIRRSHGTRGVLLHWLAGALCLLSLAFYELHFGLILAVPGLIALWLADAPSLTARLRQAIRSCIPYGVVTIAYLSHRFFLVPGLGWYDPHAVSWSFHLDRILAEIANMRGTLWSVWRFVLEQLTSTSSGPWQLGLVFCVAAAVAAAGAILFARMTVGPVRRDVAPEAAAVSVLARWDDATRDLGIALIGLVLLVAGYLPILPSVYGVAWPTSNSSRVGYAATFGAALAVTGFISLGSRLAEHSLRRGAGSVVVITAVSLLVGLGTAHSFLLARQYEASWAVQKDFYRDLFRLMPDPPAETTILIVGAEDAIGTAPAIDPYGLDGALELLYPGRTLHAYPIESADWHDQQRDLVTNALANGAAGPAEQGRIALFGYDGRECLTQLGTWRWSAPPAGEPIYLIPIEARPPTPVRAGSSPMPSPTARRLLGIDAGAGLSTCR